MNDNEIYNCCSCPVCGHDKFYSCEVGTSEGDSGGPPTLEIRPPKLKFTLIESYRFSLPYRWAACPNCGGVFTKIDGDNVKSRIKRWLNSEVLENTSASKCNGCQSDSAILWGFQLGDKTECYLQFNWAKSFNFSFGFGERIKVEEQCILCTDCGLVQVRSTPREISRYSHNRYLKHWPFKLMDKKHNK